MKRLRRWICLLGAVFFALSTHAPASGENGLANPIGAADSLVMAGSELYFSAGTNLYRWDGTGAAVPVARGVEGELTGGGDALYLLSLRQRRLTRLAADEAGHLSPCQTCPLDNPMLLDATGALRSLMGYAFAGGWLFLVVESDHPFQADVLAYHVEDGKWASLKGQSIHGIAAFGGTSVLLAVYGPGQTGSELVVFDARTGEQQTFAVLDDLQPTALACAPEEDLVCVEAEGVLYACDRDGDPLPVATAVEGEPHGYACLMGESYVSLRSGSGIGVFPVEFGGIRPLLLAFAGEGYVDGDTNPLFSKRYPNVIVRFRTDRLGTDFAAELIAGTGTADVYLFQASSPMYRAVISKGYALDLSVSTILRDAAGSYYPFLSDALHAPDGTLAAMPLGALWCPVLYEYYPDAWREAGLEVPTTAAGLLDACIAFSRRDDLLSDGWRLFMDLSEASVLKRQMLQIVLQSYLTEFAADDGYVEIDTPAFRALLQKYEEALPALDRIAALTEPPGPNGYDAEEAAKTCLLSSLSPDLLPQEERGVESAFLLLTVTGESEAVVGADATVLVVNPSSPNRELAVAYLECYAQGLGAHERIQYMPDEATPVERDSYGAEQTLLAEEEAAVLSALAQAEPEDESGLRARLASVRENLRALEEHRYATTPEQIAKYKRLAPRLRIFKDLGLNFFMRISPEMATLLNQYMEGAVDTDRFIARYAAMARMIYLENSPR